ncbi:hypothetical protein D3C86_1884090 [compost metagenome]
MCEQRHGFSGNFSDNRQELPAQTLIFTLGFQIEIRTVNNEFDLAVDGSRHCRSGLAVQLFAEVPLLLSRFF